MKGIVLAGGTGTRLHPMTLPVSKQLLPVYDKPMIYYPVTTLMLAGIRNLLMITRPADLDLYRQLFRTADDWGIEIQFATQATPAGIADALLVGREFLAGERCALILGDNIFYGNGLSARLQNIAARPTGATILCCHVPDPRHYGVVSFDVSGHVADIEEKPARPKSNFAVTGLYFYDSRVADIAASVTPSANGELEITTVNQAYLAAGRLNVETLGRGFAWFDAGTPDSLLEAAHFVQTLEKRQGLRIACPEEIAWRNGWIDDERLAALAHPHVRSQYGRYLNSLLGM